MAYKTLRGSKGVRYLVLEPQDDCERGCGHVVSRHTKVGGAKAAVKREHKAARYDGHPATAYVWDLKHERELN